MGKISKIIAFCKQIEACRRHYRCGRILLYTRALKLLLAEFSPTEIILWGMLDPGLTEQGLARFVSKERFSRFQSSVSPPGHACLLEDKEVFSRYSEALDFPIPETIAFLSNTAVWYPGGESAGSGNPLDGRLKSLEGSELIIKPTDGVYGRGVEAVMVEDSKLLVRGQLLSLEEFMGTLLPGVRYVLQRRLYNHPRIEQLAGLKTLQAIRVVTALPELPATRGHVMSASLRLSANEDVINNFNYGRGGNIRAKIDVGSGKIVRAVRASASGFGLEEVQSIDRTRQALLGFEMPLWSEMRELLEVKAALFYPIRLVGWDVALTPQGPMVLEGNFWFDPAENAFGDVRSFVDRINSNRLQV